MELHKIQYKHAPWRAETRETQKRIRAHAPADDDFDIISHSVSTFLGHALCVSYSEKRTCVTLCVLMQLKLTICMRCRDKLNIAERLKMTTMRFSLLCMFILHRYSSVRDHRMVPLCERGTAFCESERATRIGNITCDGRCKHNLYLRDTLTSLSPDPIYEAIMKLSGTRGRP